MEALREWEDLFKLDLTFLMCYSQPRHETSLPIHVT